MDQRNNRTLEALLAKGVAQAMPDLPGKWNFAIKTR